MVAIVCVKVIVEERSLYEVVVVEETSLIKKKERKIVSLSEGTDWERRKITSI